MAIRKSIRFEVFKRDGFQCAYCGKAPPQVCLEVDHVDPKTDGGSDDINNLITACFDCNRGKRHVPLTAIPSKLNENLEVLAERELQLKEYRKLTQKIERRIRRDIVGVAKIYSDAFSDWQLSDSFCNAQIRTFVTKLPLEEVKEAMYLAVNRGIGKDRAIKYFCGICWNKIKAVRDAQ
jgi:hypothetical protein